MLGDQARSGWAEWVRLWPIRVSNPSNPSNRAEKRRAKGRYLDGQTAVNVIPGTQLSAFT